MQNTGLFWNTIQQVEDKIEVWGYCYVMQFHQFSVGMPALHGPFSISYSE